MTLPRPRGRQPPDSFVIRRRLVVDARTPGRVRPGPPDRGIRRHVSNCAALNRADVASTRRGPVAYSGVVPCFDEVPSIERDAYVLLTGSHPAYGAAFPEAAWERLDGLLAALEYRRQTRGDVADHYLDVAMLVTCDPRPTVVRGADELVEFFTRGPRFELFHRLRGRPGALHLRRAQVNRMTTGDHNHFHRDTDDDPAYTLAVLVYPGDPDDWDGGELHLEGAGAAIRPPRRSVLAFRADVGHRLGPLGACRRPRLSIVLLFGDHAAARTRAGS